MQDIQWHAKGIAAGSSREPPANFLHSWCPQTGHALQLCKLAHIQLATVCVKERLVQIHDRISAAATLQGLVRIQQDRSCVSVLASPQL